MSELAAVKIVTTPEQASALLNPLRLRMIDELSSPDSAAGLARKLNLPRQKINYHLRELERAGLVELEQTRRKGNCIERVVRTVARSFLISPETLGAIAPDPDKVRDRFSSAYMTAVAAKTIRDLSVLRRRADKAGKKLPTFTWQSHVRFASAADRAAFTDELSNEIARLVAKYHDESAADGRAFELTVGTYPAITKDEDGKPLSTKGDIR